MKIEALFDPATFTLTYVVFDPATRDAVVIDPVLDYDPLSSAVSTGSLERLDAFLRANDLKVHYVLETHAHADHLSGSQHLKERYGAQVGIGARIDEVQRVFRDVFDLPSSFPTDGEQFDCLFLDGEVFSAGSLTIRVMATPGHTPACVSYLIEDAVFTGDALFMEDSGTGRCDFPGGSADALYGSVHDRLYGLPDGTRVFTGHDYQPNGRELRYETTVGMQKARNLQLRADTNREDYVAARKARDVTLSAPRLLYPSVQVNINAGILPEPRHNGRRYLTVPLVAPVQELYRVASTNPLGHRDVRPQAVFADHHATRVVDVREPDEFTGELGHIEGAELVPLGSLPSASEGWRKDQAVVVVCRSGKRSERAATALTAAGFPKVMNMVGGMLAWKEAGLPVASP